MRLQCSRNEIVTAFRFLRGGNRRWAKKHCFVLQHLHYVYCYSYLHVLLYVFTYVRISYTFTWNVEDCEQPYASYPISKWKIGFRGALRVHSELLAGNLPLSWFSHSRNGVVTFWSSVFILVIVVEVHWKCGKNDGGNALLACILSSRPAQMKDRRRWNLSVVTYRFLDCVR